MNRIRLATWVAVSVGFALAPGLSYGQSTSLTPFDKLPDWSGLWMMMGGTVFDTATQSGKGGAITPGVREHPPYTEAYEKKYEEQLARRDANRFPDVITNCGV